MLKFTFLTSFISYWTRPQLRSPPRFEALSIHYVEVCHVPARKVGFICDLTLFQALSSSTMSFPTMPENAGSSPNCKDKIR